MISQLKYYTVKPQLREILLWLMAEELFIPFRLEGGTLQDYFKDCADESQRIQPSVSCKQEL